MVDFIWPVIIEKHFSLHLTKVDIHFGHVLKNMLKNVSWQLIDQELEFALNGC